MAAAETSQWSEIRGKKEIGATFGLKREKKLVVRKMLLFFHSTISRYSAKKGNKTKSVKANNGMEESLRSIEYPPPLIWQMDHSSDLYSAHLPFSLVYVTK